MSIRIIRSQAGIGLIEVMITGAIMSILTVAFLSMIDNQRQANTYLEDNLSRTSLYNEALTVLSDPSFCVQTLGNLPIGPPKSTKEFTLKDRLGNSLIDPTTHLGKFENLQIAANLQNMAVSGANASGAAVVTIKVDRIRKGGGPSNLQPITVNTNISLDSTGKVASCGSSPSIDCLTDIPGVATDFPTIHVPADAKAFSIVTPPGTCTYQTSPPKSGYQENHSGTYATVNRPDMNLVVLFGHTTAGGQVLQAGGTLTSASASTGSGPVTSYYYNGVLLATAPGCGYFAPLPPDYKIAMQTLGATCPKTTKASGAILWK